MLLYIDAPVLVVVGPSEADVVLHPHQSTPNWKRFKCLFLVLNLVLDQVKTLQLS